MCFCNVVDDGASPESLNAASTQNPPCPTAADAFSKIKPNKINSGTVLEAKDYAVSGSGANYVIGFLDLHYPTHVHGAASSEEDNGDASSSGDRKQGGKGEGDEDGEGGKGVRLGRGRRHTALSRAEAEEMVQRALALAVGRDSHSGVWVVVGVCIYIDRSCRSTASNDPRHSPLTQPTIPTPHTGGPVTLAVIDAGGVQKRVVSPKELEAAMKKKGNKGGGGGGGGWGGGWGGKGEKGR